MNKALDLIVGRIAEIGFVLFFISAYFIEDRSAIESLGVAFIKLVVWAVIWMLFKWSCDKINGYYK